MRNKLFNIGGPCNPADHYMLPAAERLPEVMQLVNNKQYFVLHAPRQCGKTTGFLSLMQAINAKGDMVALYLTVEAAQAFTDPDDVLPKIAHLICNWAVDICPTFMNCTVKELEEGISDSNPISCIQSTFKYLAQKAGKPMVVFIDEIDCLSEGTLISFLRQLRSGKIATSSGMPFPISVSLIGLRNIRDYKMRVRPESQSTGEASPFNVITKAMTIGMFTKEDLVTLYAQHTAETGQKFEQEAIDLAWDYSRGQPYLVNALARWCVEEIHKSDYSLPITGADMAEAKENIIRERGTHLDSLMEKCKDQRVRPVIEQVMLGGEISHDEYRDNIDYALDLGIVVMDGKVLKPANPIYQETIGRYLSRGKQDDIEVKIQETPWVKDNGLDMEGLLKAFQQFWRENAREGAVPFQYREAYPHLVLQAFLQRVINGGGQIDREMALGSERLDLGVHFRGAVYAIEVKKKSYYDKSHEKAYRQVESYMDKLGVAEGWLVVADSDLSKPWDDKIAYDDLVLDGKTIHIVKC